MANHNRAERAKIFAPFDALTGFHEALREKERIVVPQFDLSEEMKEELDYKLHQLSPRDIITVIYYDHEQYVKITGILAQISPTSHTLQIVNTKISFENIYDIQGDCFID